jgi:hypothetical protein
MAFGPIVPYVPYIVFPQLEPGSNQTFDPAVGLGDVAVVIFKHKTAAARRAMQASSKTCCILCFRIQPSPRTN